MSFDNLVLGSYLVAVMLSSGMFVDLTRSTLLIVINSIMNVIVCDLSILFPSIHSVIKIYVNLFLVQGYVVLNRPWAFVQWLEKADIEEE